MAEVDPLCSLPARIYRGAYWNGAAKLRLLGMEQAVCPEEAFAVAAKNRTS